MASRKEYEMLFQLDAKLGSSYTSTFSKAKSGPSELQKEIRSLQSVQADISAYTKQQAAVEKTQAKLDNLNKQYQLLQQEIKETGGPTTSLERESAKLEQRIGDTSNALAAQKEKLGATAKSLNEAGVGTDNLGSKSQDLADKLNTLRAKEEAAAESAEEYGDKGTSSIEAVSQAFAAAKVYEGLEQIKDAYMDCINSAGDFEASMSNVEALSGASGDQLQALTDKAKEMGATTKFTAGESADALSYMALAGWDTQSMLQGISPVMELAAAANMDLASASDIVTDYLTAFGLTASDTTHFVDVMAYAMSHSNTNVEQLGEAYKACAATAKSMGYFFDTPNDPFYDRVEQSKISDIAFLQRLCTNAGLNIKATKGKLVIYDQSDYEQRPVVIEADYRDTSFTKWKLNTKTADTKYASCRVSYVEPATGACMR